MRGSSSALRTGIPSSWTAVLDERGIVTLAPPAWQRPGFWEDYFDAAREAVAEFEEAKDAILEEEQGPER
jgi:hypothetical protein